MQVDAIAVELRPRPMSEAADLGARLVQAHARSIWLSCLPVFLAVFALALATVEIADWLPGLVIFVFKPWMDRSILFVLSRAVFGQSTRFSDLWQAQREVWWRQLLGTLTLRRLSGWRAFTQPIYQLEGQQGTARRERRRQLLMGRRGAAVGMHVVFANVEMILGFGMLGLALWLVPGESRKESFDWFMGEGGVYSALVGATAYALVVAMLEPFYVAAGFAMYLNRRVQLEAWDIEQEFRRAF